MAVALTKVGECFLSPDTLDVQLLAGGEPVPGALIAARHGSQADSPITAVRTDAGGKVQLTLDRPGAWLLRNVHMVRGAQSGEGAIDWESCWTSLVFEIPAADALGAAR